MAIRPIQPKELSRDQITVIETRLPALKALNDATLDKPRGFEISKADAVRLAGGEKEFTKAAKYWKASVLWLRGITIEYVHSIKGYRFIQVEQHLLERHERTLRACERKHRDEALRLGLIRDADLSNDHQRRLRILQADQHSHAAGVVNSQRAAIEIAITRPETLPRLAVLDK